MSDDLIARLHIIAYECYEQHGPDRWVTAVEEAADALEAAEARVKDLETMVDKLLNHCPEGECGECSEIVCPYGDPLHLHHDGCPSCCSADGTLAESPRRPHR